MTAGRADTAPLRARSLVALMALSACRCSDPALVTVQTVALPREARLVTAGSAPGAAPWAVFRGRDGRLGLQVPAASGSARTVPLVDGRVVPSPDGRTLALLSPDGLRLVDALSGEPMARLAGLRHPMAAAWSPDGRTLAEVDGLGRLRIFDPANAAVLVAIETQVADAETVEFSSDARHVAVSGKAALALIDLAQGLSQPIPLPSARTAFARDGEHLLVSSGGETSLFRADGSIVGPVPGSALRGASPDGRVALLEAGVGRASLVETGTGSLRCIPELGPDERRVAFSADGGRLAVAGSGRLAVIRTSDCRKVGTAAITPALPESISFGFDGRSLIVGTSGSVLIVALEADAAAQPPEVAPALPTLPTPPTQLADEGRLAERIEPLEGRFGNVHWLPGQQHLLLAAEGGASETFDVDAGRRSLGVPATTDRVAFVAPFVRGLVHGAEKGRLMLSMDGSSTSSDSGHVRLWSLAVGDDGRSIVSAGADGTIALWEPTSSGLVERRRWRWGAASESAERDLRDLAVAPEAKLIYGLQREGGGVLARRWEPETATATTLLTLEGPAALALSPDGRQLALAGGHELRLYDTQERRVTGVIALPEPAGALAFSADGKRLGVASAQGGATVRIRDLGADDWALELQGDGSDQGVTSLALSPDGLYAAASTGGAVTVWRITR